MIVILFNITNYLQTSQILNYLNSILLILYKYFKINVNSDKKKIIINLLVYKK